MAQLAPPPAPNAHHTRAPEFARDIDAGAYLETLLVAAVSSVLLTRLYLEATGYPRIGGGPLHFAHLLWGGLLMLIALVLLLATLGKRVKHFVAAIGGAGFGLFIDELGKFITSDNDYFFQPAVALIYMIMVLLFLVFRAIERRNPSSMELLVNAADHVREVVLDGATRMEVARGLELLTRSGAVGPLAEHIRALLESAECELDRRPNRLARMTAWASRTYEQLVAWRWFERGVLVLFVGQAVFALLAEAILGWVGLADLRANWPRWLSGDYAPLHMSLDAASVATTVVSLALVTIGVVRLPHERLSAYRWFERSLLVSILVTQVLVFWQDQLAALGGLVWNLVLLVVLRSMSTLERARVHQPRIAAMRSAFVTGPDRS